MSVSNAQGVSVSQSAAGLGPMANGLQALFGEAVAGLSGRSSAETGDGAGAQGANLFRQQLESALLGQEAATDGQVLPLDPNFSNAVMATFAAMDEAILLEGADPIGQAEILARAQQALAQAQQALAQVQEKLGATQAAESGDQTTTLQQGLARAQQGLAQSQETLAAAQAAKVKTQSSAAEAAVLLKSDVVNRFDEALETNQQSLAQAQQALTETQQKLAAILAGKPAGQSNSEQVAQAIRVDNAAGSDDAIAMKQAVSLQQPLAQAQQALADAQLKLQLLQSAQQAQQPAVKAQETLEVIRNAQAVPQLAAAAVEELVADLGSDSKMTDQLSQQAITDRASPASLGLASGTAADKAMQETGANRSVQESRSGAQLEAARASLGSGPLNVEVLRLSRQGGGRAVIEVTPPNQGPIRLDLQLDGSGRAHLVVEGLTDAMRARLEGTAHFLRQDMASLGLALNLEMRERSDGSPAQGFGQSMGEGQNAASGSQNLQTVKQSVQDSTAELKAPAQTTADSGEVNLYA